MEIKVDIHFPSVKSIRQKYYEMYSNLKPELSNLDNESNFFMFEFTSFLNTW